MRRRGLCRLAAAHVAVCVVAGCGESGAPSPAPAATESESALFREVAEAAGLDFVHFNGMTGQLYFSEHMGGGAALADFDGDGDLDVFLTQGALIEPGAEPADATFPWSGVEPPRDRLYRNDSDAGTLRFTDVTATSGIEGREYAIGAAVGDFDNDGLPDLYVTQWNAPNRLYRSEGGLRFRDVTEGAGVGDPSWSVSASFVDYDRDGWLDLFVANYTAFALPLHKACRTYTGAIDYCGPQAFRPLPDALFRNRGDGTFESVAAKVGVAAEPGSGLGVVALDANGDLWPDLYVANDQMPNRMWLGGPDGRFRDGALLDGTALNAEGHAEAGMGVTVGDADRDGREDLLVTHLTRETNTLYRNDGTPGTSSFYDATAESGLGAASFAQTGFGVGWLDVDLDGWLDLFVANGAVKHLEPLVRAGDPYPMHQPNQLFMALGGGRFEAVAGDPELERSEVSRGAAFGDLDNDGDTDIVVVNNAGPVRLLENRVGQDAAWIGLDVVDETGRPAIGASVDVEPAPAGPLVGTVRRDGSYASASDPRVVFGLGDDETPRDVTVRWPDGARERWAALAARRYHRLVRGRGEAEAAVVEGVR